jgi:hypothetical protein
MYRILVDGRKTMQAQQEKFDKIMVKLQRKSGN